MNTAPRTVRSGFVKILRTAMLTAATCSGATFATLTAGGGDAWAGARSVHQIPSCAQKATEEAALKAARHAKKSKAELKQHAQRVKALGKQCASELRAQKAQAKQEKARRAQELEARKRAARAKALQAQAEEKRRRDAKAAEDARRLRDAKVAEARRNNDTRRRNDPARPRLAPGAPIPVAAPTPAPAARKRPTRARSPELLLLEQDRRALGSKKGEFFGIRLGERLRLPRCQPLLTAEGEEAKSCVQQEEEAPVVARQIADLDEVELPSEVELSLVQLSKEDCPRWVGRQCLVSVATQTGVVMGISFVTDSKREKTVTSELTDRYETKPASVSPVSCSGSAGITAKDRVWEIPHLTTAFRPVGGRTCDEGRVLVETRTMQQLVRRPDVANAQE